MPVGPVRPAASQSRDDPSPAPSPRNILLILLFYPLPPPSPCPPLSPQFYVSQFFFLNRAPFLLIIGCHLCSSIIEVLFCATHKKRPCLLGISGLLTAPLFSMLNMLENPRNTVYYLVLIRVSVFFFWPGSRLIDQGISAGWTLCI